MAEGYKVANQVPTRKIITTQPVTSWCKVDTYGRGICFGH